MGCKKANRQPQIIQHEFLCALLSSVCLPVAHFLRLVDTTYLATPSLLSYISHSPVHGNWQLLAVSEATFQSYASNSDNLPHMGLG